MAAAQYLYAHFEKCLFNFGVHFSWVCMCIMKTRRKKKKKTNKMRYNESLLTTLCFASNNLDHLWTTCYSVPLYLFFLFLVLLLPYLNSIRSIRFICIGSISICQNANNNTNSVFIEVFSSLSLHVFVHFQIRLLRIQSL